MKTISILCVLTLLTESLLAGPSIHKGTLSSSALPLEARISPLTLAIPEMLGRVTEVWGNKEPRLVLIQDAHGQYSAQKNIQKILRRIEKRQGIRALFIEGAAGALDSNLLRFGPDKKRNRKILTLLAAHSEIGGPELFWIEAENNKRKIQAFGIEDPDIYAKNLSAYQTVTGNRKQTDKNLGLEFSSLLSRASRSMPRDLYAVFKIWFEYEVRDTKDLYRHLQELNLAAGKFLAVNLSEARSQLDWPMLARYFELKRRESAVKPENEKKEREKLNRWYEQQVEGGRLKVEANKKRVEGGRLKVEGDRRNFWEKFYESYSSQGFDFKDYPAFFQAEGARILQEELDVEILMHEIRKVTGLLIKKLALQDSDRELMDLAHQFIFKKKLLTLSLTREEYENRPQTGDRRQKSIDHGPSTMDFRLQTGDFRTQAAAENFYRLAVERDRVMAEEAVTVISGKGKGRRGKGEGVRGKSEKKILDLLSAERLTLNAVNVLIAGGFHTPGLTKILKEKNISYAVIQPRIPEIQSDKDYVASMMGETPHWDLDRFQTPLLHTQTLRNPSPAVPLKSWNGYLPPLSQRRIQVIRNLLNLQAWSKTRSEGRTAGDLNSADSTLRRKVARGISEEDRLAKVREAANKLKKDATVQAVRGETGFTRDQIYRIPRAELVAAGVILKQHKETRLAKVREAANKLKKDATVQAVMGETGFTRDQIYALGREALVAAGVILRRPKGVSVKKMKTPGGKYVQYKADIRQALDSLKKKYPKQELGFNLVSREMEELGLKKLKAGTLSVWFGNHASDPDVIQLKREIEATRNTIQGRLDTFLEANKGLKITNKMIYSALGISASRWSTWKKEHQWKAPDNFILEDKNDPARRKGGRPRKVKLKIIPEFPGQGESEKGPVIGNEAHEKITRSQSFQPISSSLPPMALPEELSTESDVSETIPASIPEAKTESGSLVVSGDEPVRTVPAPVSEAEANRGPAHPTAEVLLAKKSEPPVEEPMPFVREEAPTPEMEELYRQNRAALKKAAEEFYNNYHKPVGPYGRVAVMKPMAMALLRPNASFARGFNDLWNDLSYQLRYVPKPFEWIIQPDSNGMYYFIIYSQGYKPEGYIKKLAAQQGMGKISVTKQKGLPAFPEKKKKGRSEARTNPIHEQGAMPLTAVRTRSESRDESVRPDFDKDFSGNKEDEEDKKKGIVRIISDGMQGKLAIDFQSMTAQDIVNLSVQFPYIPETHDFLPYTNTPRGGALAITKAGLSASGKSGKPGQILEILSHNQALVMAKDGPVELTVAPLTQDPVDSFFVAGDFLWTTSPISALSFRPQWDPVRIESLNEMEEPILSETREEGQPDHFRLGDIYAYRDSVRFGKSQFMVLSNPNKTGVNAGRIRLMSESSGEESFVAESNRNDFLQHMQLISRVQMPPRPDYVKAGKKPYEPGPFSASNGISEKYLKTQEYGNSNTPPEWEAAYESHSKDSGEWMIKGAEGMKGGHALIMGVGHGRDHRDSFRRLVEQFDEVTVVDLDKKAVEGFIKSLPDELRKKVIVLDMDLGGFMADFTRRFETEILSKEPDFTKALNQTLRLIGEILPKPLELPREKYDYVISALVYNQLAGHLRSYIANEMQVFYRVPAKLIAENTGLLRIQSSTALRLGTKHLKDLRSLVSGRGAVVIVTDESAVLYENSKVLREELTIMPSFLTEIKDAFSVADQTNWIWNYRPPELDSSGKGKVYKIQGLILKPKEKEAAASPAERSGTLNAGGQTYFWQSEVQENKRFDDVANKVVDAPGKYVLKIWVTEREGGSEKDAAAKWIATFEENGLSDISFVTRENFRRRGIMDALFREVLRPYYLKADMKMRGVVVEPITVSMLSVLALSDTKAKQYLGTEIWNSRNVFKDTNVKILKYPQLSTNTNITGPFRKMLQTLVLKGYGFSKEDILKTPLGKLWRGGGVLNPKITVETFTVKGDKKIRLVIEGVVSAAQTNVGKASGQRSEVRSQEADPQDSRNNANARGILAVAEDVTGKILEAGSGFYFMLFPKKTKLEVRRYRESVRAEAEIYQEILRGGGTAVVDSRILGKLDKETQEKYFETILRGSESIPSLNAKIYFVRDVGNQLKNTLFQSAYLKQNPTLAAKARRLFVFDVKDFSDIDPRIKKEMPSVSVLGGDSHGTDFSIPSGFFTEPARESTSVNETLVIPGLWTASEELDTLDAVSKLRYANHLTQLQLLAAEKFKGDLVFAGLHKEHRELDMAKFLKHVGVLHPELDARGFFKASAALLASESFGRQLSAYLKTSQAA